MMNFTYSPGPTNTSNNVMLARAKNLQTQYFRSNFSNNTNPFVKTYKKYSKLKTI